MVEAEGFGLEENEGEDDEHCEGYDLLDHLELHQRKRSAVCLETDTVRRYLQYVFKKCDSPTDENNGEQRQTLTPFHFLETKMPIPREGHECV